MRAAVILPVALGMYLAAEFLIFHTGLYQSIAEPNSSSGLTTTLLGNEKKRRIDGPRQVVAVGDSRMGFFPKYANELQPATGYTFATIAVPGSTPRVWYYLLRDVDPNANRYAAILIPFEDYEDLDKWEDMADRMTDPNYLAAITGWRDVFEFGKSYHDPERRYQVIRGLLFKGTVYQRDFHDFLLRPSERLQKVMQARGRDSAPDFYNYVGPAKGLEDYRLDWNARKLYPPPGADPGLTERIENRFLGPRPPERGNFSGYLHQWIGKICERYRGSRTRLIFFRLARGPWVRRDQPPQNPHSVVRDLGRLPGVIVAPEHEFDTLERPELFMDELHLNGPGEAAFSKALGRTVERLLGSPGAGR